jgi:hypothetical protein
MTVKSFDSFDDVLDFVTKQTAAANERVKPSQLELRKGDFYAMDSGMDFAIFGQLQDDPDEQGYALARAYSRILPEGELGDVHISTAVPLTPDEFEAAKASGWQNTDVVIRALRRMTGADAAAEKSN